MERITESSLLADSHMADPHASGWFADNVLHPFMNGTGVAQIYNNFVKDDNKIAPAYVPEAKTLSTDWAVHTLSSATGAVLTYALAGKAANMGMGAIASAAGLEGTAARVLSSATTAQIVGAGLYDFAKAPNAGETRLGNAAGTVAAFGAFAMGNEMLGASKTIASSSLLTGLGRVGVGMAGGLTSLETSHMVARMQGVQNDVNWNDRFNSMAGGAFINVAMPVVQKGISTMVDGAMKSKPFQLPTEEDVNARLASDSRGQLPQAQIQDGPLGVARKIDLPDDLESKAAGIKARPTKPSGSGAEAELPELILLKQQFDPEARQAQIEKVASQLADFVGQAKKSVQTAVYDFRLTDPTVEKTVIDAYNKAAESGVDVKIAFFQPEPTKGGGHGIANIAMPGGDGSGEVPIAHGPSPDLLAKLSPKITVQHVTVNDGAAAGMPPDPFAAAMGGAKPAGAGAESLIDLQSGKNGSLSSDVNESGIRGDGHLMHNKYIVVDAGTSNGRVWTGSTNFTDDAFGSQDNNIIILKSPKLANAYSSDFNQMWKAGTLTGTGANLHETASVGDGGSITVAFSPGDGAFIDSEYAKRFAEAKDSVHIASMVISSPQMLKALVDDMDRGVKVTGIYDGPQMDQVERNWSKFPSSADKLEMWNKVKDVLVRKNSHPYSPEGIHDFLHDKMYVVDGKNAGVGSFNFSKNATMNAENVVMMDGMPSIASQYTNYIEDLVKTYDGKPMQGDPIVAKPELPKMSAEEAHATFKTMVEEGKIPHGKFVDSVAGQKFPLTEKQLAVVLDIIAKARAKRS